MTQDNYQVPQNNRESCFFYIDFTGAKTFKEGRIWPLCMTCGKTQKDSWFWNKDFGPFEIRCHKCNHLIYEVRNPNSDSRQPGTDGGHS